MRKLVLLLTLFGFAISLHADPVTVHFASFNNTGQWQNGYPYYLFVQGMGFLSVMCDDYVHAGSTDYAWQANETNLGNQDLSLTRFGDMSGALTLYDKAGWLLLQTKAQGINQWKDMTYAVWNIFDSAAPCDSGCEFWLAAAENEAMKGFQGIDFHQVGVLTPAYDQHGTGDPNGPQEFLYLTNGNPPNVITPSGGTVPEPGSLLLFATGLAAAWRGRRFL